MTPGKTLELFGYYLLVLGTTLALFPDMAAAMIFVPPVHNPFVTFVGILDITLGYYYIRAGRAQSIEMAQATVIGRQFIMLAMAAMVMGGAIPLNYLVIGLADSAGGIWTAWALRRTGHRSVAFI